MYITPEFLRRRGACAEQVYIVEREWPDGAETTVDVLMRALELDVDIQWLATLLPRDMRKAYDEATAIAWKAYDEAIAPAGKAYDEAIAIAWKAYLEAIAIAKNVYDEARSPAGDVYDEATAPAWKAYLEATAIALSAYHETIAPALSAALHDTRKR